MPVCGVAVLGRVLTQGGQEDPALESHTPDGERRKELWCLCVILDACCGALWWLLSWSVVGGTIRCDIVDDGGWRVWNVSMAMLNLLLT